VQILVPDIGSTNQESSHVQSTMHIILDPTETSGEAFEVRSLRVHSVRWATKPHPLTASIHCSYAQHLETQHPEALRCNNLLKFWTQTNQKAKLPKNPPTMTTPSCTDYRSVAIDPSCHSFSTNNILLPTTQMQSKSPQTHIPLTDPHFRFYLPINLRLGPLKSLITPRHHPT